MGEKLCLNVYLLLLVGSLLLHKCRAFIVNPGKEEKKKEFSPLQYFWFCKLTIEGSTVSPSQLTVVLESARRSGGTQYK